MRAVLKKLRPYRKRIILGQSFKFFEVILELTVPMLLAHMVDRGIASADRGLILKYILICLTLAVSGMLAAFICQYQASVASQSYGTELRNALFQKILNLPAETAAEFGSASLQTRLTTDIQILQQGLAMLIRLLPRTPFICIGAIFMVARLAPSFVWLFFLAVLIFSAILFILIKTLLPLIQASQEATDRLTGRLLELLSGIKVIRALVKSQTKANQYHEANQEIVFLMKKIGRYSALLNPLTQLVLNLIGLAILWLSFSEIRLGRLAGGELIALINYLAMLLVALLVISNLVLLYSNVIAAGIRVSRVLTATDRKDREEAKLVKAHDPASLRSATNSLEVKSLDFSYPGSASYLFKDLSFSLPIGKSLSIIGPTGSGKSTLSFLFEGRYEPRAGQILLFGQDIRSYPEDQLLDLVHLVPQSAFLFSGSLRQSLSLGLDGVTDREIWRALDLAQAQGFIANNAEGLDQRVDRGGQNFSGGQKQRLAIARAILRKPKILIFDDCTGALDAKTSADLYKALGEAPELQDTCLIMVSQRIATARRADLILLLDDGLKKGLGSHSQLLADNPLYQEIYRSQTDLLGLDRGSASGGEES